ncbi:MAG: serine protease [Rubrivivax sp.]
MPSRRALLAHAVAIAAAGGFAPAARAGLPEIIEAARPSVLPIGRFDPLGSPRFAFRGTAFAVGDGRHVVTNAHVLTADGSPTGAPLVSAANAAPGEGWALQVPLPDGGSDWRRVELVQQDRSHDLALLRLVDGAPLAPLALAPDGRLREGLAVLLVGFPIAGVLGFQPVSHRGMVSSIAAFALPAAIAARLGDRAIARLRGGDFDVVQLDATAYPGNSGGPVLDAATGEVVAVVNMVLVKGSRESALRYPSGISYAVPARWIAPLLVKAR